MKLISLSKIGSIISFIFNNLVNKIPLKFVRNIFLFLWINKYPIKTNFSKNIIILNGRKIYVGSSVSLGEGCLLDGRKYSIKIGSNVCIGTFSSILTLGHDPQCKNFNDVGGEVIIEEFVEIGSKVTILPNIKIGHHSKILPGSVIVKDILPYTLVGGNPSRAIKKL